MSMRLTVIGKQLTYSCLCCMILSKNLSKIKRTAVSCDDLPAWMFRNCSYELAGTVAHILNCSFSTGVLLSYWLRAIVTPVPKVNKPFTFSDYIPQSVTLILSRLSEKLVIQKWLRPVIPPALISDQYAFKPTGSTTAALVHFTNYDKKSGRKFCNVV